MVQLVKRSLEQLDLKVVSGEACWYFNSKARQTDTPLSSELLQPPNLMAPMPDKPRRDGLNIPALSGVKEVVTGLFKCSYKQSNTFSTKGLILLLEIQ